MTDASLSINDEARLRRNKRVALYCLAFIAFMVGAAYAAVPIYNMLCRLTGLDGTTQVSTGNAKGIIDRDMTVRFDSNVAGGLPWAFEPETKQITLRTGETKTVFYRVTNLTDRAISATATYNVTPDQAGPFFDKLNCFCFSEQTLGPKETAEWPVVFFLDPALEKDDAMKRVDQLTLSYTFFESKKPGRSAEQTAPKSRI